VTHTFTQVCAVKHTHALYVRSAVEVLSAIDIDSTFQTRCVLRHTHAPHTRSAVGVLSAIDIGSTSQTKCACDTHTCGVLAAPSRS